MLGIFERVCSVCHEVWSKETNYTCACTRDTPSLKRRCASCRNPLTTREHNFYNNASELLCAECVDRTRHPFVPVMNPPRR